jgi:hypothetical protein
VTAGLQPILGAAIFAQWHQIERRLALRALFAATQTTVIFLQHPKYFEPHRFAESNLLLCSSVGARFGGRLWVTVREAFCFPGYSQTPKSAIRYGS